MSLIVVLSQPVKRVVKLYLRNEEGSVLFYQNIPVISKEQMIVNAKLEGAIIKGLAEHGSNELSVLYLDIRTLF